MATQIKPGSLAYTSAQMMQDARKVESMLSVYQRGELPSDADMVFICQLMTRLPAVIVNEIRPMVAKIEQAIAAKRESK